MLKADVNILEVSGQKVNATHSLSLLISSLPETLRDDGNSLMDSMFPVRWNPATVNGGYPALEMNPLQQAPAGAAQLTKRSKKS